MATQTSIQNQSDTTVRLITFEEFFAFNPHPLQRDTETRARKAVHLKKWWEPHRVVNIAEFCGENYLLDAHTRREMWMRGLCADVPKHTKLIGIFYSPDTEDEFHDLYKVFDNKAAVKTARDEAFGAAGLHGLELKSSLLKRNSYGMALKAVHSLIQGNSPNFSTENDIGVLTRKFKTELQLLDALNPKSDGFRAAAIASAVITFMRDPVNAAKFWDLYIKDAGKKDETEVDAVQAARNIDQYMTAERKVLSSHYEEIIGRYINAFDSFVAGKGYLSGMAAKKKRSARPHTKDFEELKRWVSEAERIRNLRGDDLEIQGASADLFS